MSSWLGPVILGVLALLVILVGRYAEEIILIVFMWWLYSRKARKQ